MPYREVKTLDPTDAAYIAGLVDGEGTITLSRRHRNESRHLVISISNTDRSMLDYVLDFTGAGKITRKRTYQPHHTASFTYSVSNRQGLALLSQLAPYLKTYKLQRAHIILSEYIRLTPRNGNYTEELRHARERFEGKVMAIKP